ncbi:MAG TPA: hypothetical protein VF761_16925 [Gemmatimonadaceae bacterium]
MIARILNTSEVETGIREAAEARASRYYPQPLMSELAPLLQTWALDDVGRVLHADARPKGVGDELTALDRVALLWLYVAAFADEMQSRCEDEEDKRISVLAQAILCRHCSQPFLHVNHGADLHALAEGLEPTGHDHVFYCPHGEEVITPRDCITDHNTPHDRAN